MPALAAPGEPRPSPKPQPIGSFPMIFLLTTCTLCAVFILWRRASLIRTVVAHQLRTWTGAEGGIRLSTDDGPPAREFLDEDDEDESEDDEPLPPHYPRAQKFQRPSVPGHPVTAAPVGRPESPTSR